MGKIRILELNGTHYEMGYQHGQVYADEIRWFTEERIRLSSDPNWTGNNLSRDDVLALGSACLEEHRLYAPELVEELQGMADATGLGLPELVIINGFTDFIDVAYNGSKLLQQQPTYAMDDCTAFLIPNEKAVNQQAFVGQTWDMHATSTLYVIMIQANPTDAPSYMAFSTTGVLGLIGMNEAGIAIGINNLMGGDGQIGVMYTFVIRKVLAQTTIEEALECITSAKLAGAHNYMIMDKNGRGYNIEAMPTYQHVEELQLENIVHTNHCLFPSTLDVQRERPASSQKASEARLERGIEVLEERAVTPELLMALTRDEQAVCVRSAPPLHVETCGAAIMRPATGELWAVWGLPTENDYERFVI